GRRSRGVDRQLEPHACAVVVESGQRDVPGEGDELTVPIAPVLPATGAGGGLVAQREIIGCAVDLVPRANARWAWKIVVAVRAVAAGVQNVTREGGETRGDAAPQRPHVGKDHD